MQWSCDEREVFDEGVVKIEESKRLSYLCCILGYWPRVDACDFCRVHLCHPLFKDYPQVIHRGRVEQAFFRFEVEIVELGDFKNIMHRVAVVSKVSASGDPNVIHIDADCGTEGFMFQDDIPIDVVHHGLERRWRISESKVHDGWFEKSVSGFKCRFLLVPLTDAYVVISPSNVKFCVYMCIAQVAN